MLPSSLSSKSFMYGLYHPYLYFLVAIFQSLFSCRYYLKSSFFRFYHLNLYLLASIILISIFSVLSAKSIPSCFYHPNLYLVFFFFPCVLICLSGSLLSRATCAAVCLAVPRVSGPSSVANIPGANARVDNV